MNEIFSKESKRELPTLASILELVNEKLTGKESLEEPFSAEISKKDVNMSDLISFGSLKIECLLRINEHGRLIFSTGKRGSTLPDFGDTGLKGISRWNGYEPKNREQFVSILQGQELSDFLEFEGIFEAINLISESMKKDTVIRIHNHPKGTLLPSLADLTVSEKSENEVLDVILTTEGLIAYSCSKKQGDLAMDYRRENRLLLMTSVESQEKYRQFLMDIGVIKKIIYFKNDAAEAEVSEIIFSKLN